MKYLAALVFVGSVLTTSSSGVFNDSSNSYSINQAAIVLTPHDLPFSNPYLPVTKTESFWDTRSTDKTAYWPVANSPIKSLPVSVQATFACLRYVESRNHLTSVSYSGAGGLYQFMPLIWKSYGGLKYAPTPELATGDQQDQVAVNVYTRNHGFYPEWQDPMCNTIY